MIDALKPLETALPAGNVLNAMAEAVRQAGQAVRDLAAADPGTGTTLTAMLWSGSQLALVHVGDTRAYVLREGRAGQHSLRGRRRHRRSGRLMEAPSCWPTATLVSFMEQAVEAMAGRDGKGHATARAAAPLTFPGVMGAAPRARHLRIPGLHLQLRRWHMGTGCTRRAIA